MISVMGLVVAYQGIIIEGVMYCFIVAVMCSIPVDKDFDVHSIY